MFGNLFRKKIRLASVEDYLAGRMTAQAFADRNAEATVYYSTPFGPISLNVVFRAACGEPTLSKRLPVLFATSYPKFKFTRKSSKP